MIKMAIMAITHTESEKSVLKENKKRFPDYQDDPKPALMTSGGKKNSASCLTQGGVSETKKTEVA